MSDLPRVRALSHTAFNVHDLVDAVEFYCEKLGLEEAFSIEVPEHFATMDHPLAEMVGEIGLVYIHIGHRSFLELFRSVPAQDSAVGGANVFGRGFTHICLEVDDLVAYVETLRDRGIEIDEEVTMGVDGSLQAWIRDPDDNRIELMEHLAGSLQSNALELRRTH